MTRDCVLYESIEQVPLDEWNEVCQAASGCFMSPSFLRAMERTQPLGAKTFHAIVYDEDGKPAACAGLSLFPIDLLMLASRKIRRGVSWIRRLFPQLGQIKILMCGQPFSAAQSHLAFAPGADRARALRLLDAQLKQIAKREGASLIVFKEFGEEECAGFDSLPEQGYVRADSLPTYELSKPFDSLETYLAALKAHYRIRIRRSQRRFDEAGCRFVRLQDPREIAEVYTPEAHALYEAVVDRSEVKLEVLSRESFLEVARELSGRVGLTMAYRAGRLIGLAWDLLDGNKFRCLFLGMDYSQTAETDLYSNLVYRTFDYAFRSGAETISIGQSSDHFKALLGCSGQPRFIYAQGVGPLLSWIVRKFASLLFPPRVPLAANDAFKAEVIPTIRKRTRARPSKSSVEIDGIALS